MSGAAEEFDLGDVERVPYHLREDSPPLAFCSACGRETWAVDEIGRVCGMTQPSGERCEGTFLSRVLP